MSGNCFLDIFLLYWLWLLLVFKHFTGGNFTRKCPEQLNLTFAYSPSGTFQANVRACLKATWVIVKYSRGCVFHINTARHHFDERCVNKCVISRFLCVWRSVGLAETPLGVFLLFLHAVKRYSRYNALCLALVYQVRWDLFRGFEEIELKLLVPK